MGETVSVQHGWVDSAFIDHSARVRSYIHARTGCRETAEDITQEVFLKLHGVENGEQISNVGHYVVRMARNLLIDHSRSASGKICSQTTATIEDAFDMAADEPSPEDMLIMRNEISGIFAALGGMSELCSRIFWQSRAEGFLNHEIAQMQGVCISTVEKNISRAKKHCASHLRALNS